MVAVMGISTLPRKRALAMTLLGSCDSFCSCLAPRVPPISHSSNNSSEAALTSLKAELLLKTLHKCISHSLRLKGEYLSPSKAHVISLSMVLLLQDAYPSCSDSCIDGLSWSIINKINPCATALMGHIPTNELHLKLRASSHIGFRDCHCTLVS